MLFLIPLAAEAIEVAPLAIEAVAAVAESTAVRAAVSEAASAVMSAEARQAATTFVTTEARALATQVGTAEGRAALVDAVGKGATDIAGQVATKSNSLWEAGKSWAVSEEGSALLTSVGKKVGTYVAKTTAIATATGYAIEKFTERATDAVMEKLGGFFDGTAANPGDVKALAESAAAFGVQANLASDMKVLAGDLAQPGQGYLRLDELRDGLALSKEALPAKAAQIDGLSARNDALQNLHMAEQTVRNEMSFGGAATPESLGALKDALSQAMLAADPKGRESLSNARDAIGEVLTKGGAHVEDALSEVSVAKERMMKSVAQDVQHLTADLSNVAENKKETMGKAVDTLTPAILEKNDKEHAKVAEQAKSAPTAPTASVEAEAPAPAAHAAPQPFHKKSWGEIYEERAERSM